MEQDLQITTQVTEELYEHLNAVSYTLFHKKKAYITYGILAALYLSYVFGIYFIQRQSYILYMIVPVSIFIIASIIYSRCNTHLVAERLARKSMLKSKNPLTMVNYIFYPNHIRIETPMTRMENGYAAIKEFAETNEYYFLFVTPINAHAIKKSSLGKSNVDLFREYIKAKTGLDCKSIIYQD